MIKIALRYTIVLLPSEYTVATLILTLASFVLRINKEILIAFGLVNCLFEQSKSFCLSSKICFQGTDAADERSQPYLSSELIVPL